MKTYHKLSLVLIFILFFAKSQAQFNFTHEIGVVAGSVTMQTDYGERFHFPSSTPTTFGVALVHYLSFYGSNYNWRNGASYFSDHFKVRSEISYYFNNSLEHKGRYIQPNTDFAAKLRAMSGTTKIFNVGMQLEYYFKNLEDYGLLFNTGDKFAPYVSLGAQYNSYTPTFETSYGSGDWRNDPTILPKPWQQNAIFPEKGTTFSFTSSIGTRYKLNNFDLVAEAKWQYFFSDKIEGLDAPRDVSGSKYNDTLIFFNVGIIYNLSSGGGY